jgi:hypothetical protein
MPRSDHGNPHSWLYQWLRLLLGGRVLEYIALDFVNVFSLSSPNIKYEVPDSEDSPSVSQPLRVTVEDFRITSQTVFDHFTDHN